jgi:tetratricopeptide (TPR) repeat protein
MVSSPVIRVVVVILMGMASSRQLAGAQEYRPGDNVVVIRNGQLRVQGQVIDDVWPGLTLEVEAVKGQYLLLNNGEPGWLNQSHVMPFSRRAIDHLTTLIKANPGDANLYSGRAQVWYELGELEISMADHNEAIRLDPSAKHYANRGIVWHSKGEYDKALANYNVALRLDPKNATAYCNRGATLQEKGEYDRAIADYNEALRLDPKSASVYNDRGNAWKAQGEYDRAIADFSEALRLDPKHLTAIGNITWLYATCPDAKYRDGSKALAFGTKACELSG